jgi:hypothetical protein
MTHPARFAHNAFGGAVASVLTWKALKVIYSVVTVYPASATRQAVASNVDKYKEVE